MLRHRAHGHHVAPVTGRGEGDAVPLAGRQRTIAEALLQARGHLVQQPGAHLIVRLQAGRQTHLQVVAADLQEAARDALDEPVGDFHHHHQRHQAQADPDGGAGQVGGAAAPPKFPLASARGAGSSTRTESA